MVNLAFTVMKGSTTVRIKFSQISIKQSSAQIEQRIAMPIFPTDHFFHRESDLLYDKKFLCKVGEFIELLYNYTSLTHLLRQK